MSVEDALMQPTLRDKITLELLHDAERYARVKNAERYLVAAVRTAMESLEPVLTDGSRDQARVRAAERMACDFVWDVVREALQE